MMMIIIIIIIIIIISLTSRLSMIVRVNLVLLKGTFVNSE